MSFVNAWTTSLIFAISIARTGMGIYTSLFGPTLLYLADNVDADIYKLSTMFTGRSFGTLLGAIMGGIIKKAVGPNFRHLLTLGAGIGILGLTDLAIPWIKEFWLLVVDVTVGGIMFGYLDAGLQALILQLWGERASRVQIQIFHLTYSVGAFVAPFIASPFLAKADQNGSTNYTCPNSESPIVTTTPASANFSTTAVPAEHFIPTGWVFVIASLWMVFAGSLMVLLAVFNVEAKVTSAVADKGYSSEDREEEPLKDLIWLFLLVTCYFFCSVATENVYYNYIYSISICSDLHFTITQASLITSIFWLGFGVGRITGVFGANFVTPGTFIIFSLAGSIVDMIFVSIFGEHNAWLVWLVSATHGYSTAMLYPSGVSWVSQITNMSETYMFVFNIGNAVGTFSMLLLAGYLFDHVDPFSVMYLILGISVANAGFFALLYYAGKRHLQKALNKKLKLDYGITDESNSLLSESDPELKHLVENDSNLIQKVQ